MRRALRTGHEPAVLVRLNAKGPGEFSVKSHRPGAVTTLAPSSTT